MPNAADRTGDGGQFDLAYKRAKEEAEKDRAEEAEKSENLESGAGRTVMQGGVRLELSRNAQKSANAGHAGEEQASRTGQGILDAVRSWITVFVGTVKDILYRIWNDPTAQDDTQIQEPEASDAETLQDAGAEETEGLPETDAGRLFERDAEIEKLLRSGDVERVIDLVTDSGHKTMAKNSTLLTYYDRTGRITPLSASDQERILHGDRNVKKL